MAAKGDENGTEEEKCRILPGPSNNEEGTSSDAVVPEILCAPDIENALEDVENEEDEEENGRIRRRQRRRVEEFFRTIGFCSCVVQKCMGNQRMCRICEPTKMEKYGRLEEDYYRIDYREPVGEKLGMKVIPFHLESPQIKECCPLLVMNTMTALNVIRGVAVQINTRDRYRYAIIEFWRDFEAERTVDDHELILALRHKQLKTRYHFQFVYQRDLDKFEYIKNKELFFIHPDAARRQTSKKKDPRFIQVLDPFFSQPYNPLADLPPLSDSESSPEKPIDIPEDVISIQDQGNVQFSKSLQEAAPVETAKSTPPKPSPIVTPEKRNLSPPPSQSCSPSREVSPFKNDDSDNIMVLEDDTVDRLVNPIFCGTVYVKQGDRDLTVAEAKRLPNQKERARWSKRYLLLRNRKLYYVDDHENMLKFYYMDDQQFKERLEKKLKTKKEKAMLELIGPISDYEVFTSVKARQHHNAPYGGSIYLKNKGGSVKKPFKIMFCPKPKLGSKNEEGEPDLSSKGKKLWVTAFRLAKHGKKLKENYKTYLDDREEYELKLKVSGDPRVPMDFTQGIGRIVHDAAEIEEIRREPKQTRKQERFEKYESFPKTALEHGRHLTQKYYHGDITRPEAERLLQEAKVDGSWMLRDSHARTNCLTISYIYSGRIHHKYLSAASYNDPSTGTRIYVATLDQILAFYDVHSLTEFYRLNKGDTMMCKLGISVKNENQRDGSPERSISGHSPAVNRPVPINLMARDHHNRSPQSIDSSNSKSSKSLKDFFSKSIQKSKGALRPKKLATGGPLTINVPGPSAAPASPPAESPQSPSQEVSSSGISSTGGQSTPESPPVSSPQDLLPSDPPSV